MEALTLKAKTRSYSGLGTRFPRSFAGHTVSNSASSRVARSD